VTRYTSAKIYAAESEIDGLGVFASKRIRKGGIVELAPIIELNVLETRLLDVATHFLFANLGNYVYSSNSNDNSVVGLGFTSLYNENKENPNATWELSVEERYIKFTALRNISQDEEILICYSDIDYSPKGWLSTYIEWMEQSREEAALLRDKKTESKFKAAISALKG